MSHRVVALTALALLLAPWGCRARNRGFADVSATSVAPKQAKVTVVDLPLALDSNGSISPSGRSRLLRRLPADSAPLTDDEQVVSTEWCLHRDGDALQCLKSSVFELHGAQPVGWRPDEEGVIVQGKQKVQSASGAFLTRLDAVLDFKRSTVVEFAPGEYHVAPVWTRDGRRIWALKGKGKDAVSITLDPFAVPLESSEQTLKASRDRPLFDQWTSAGRSRSGVILLNPLDMSKTFIETAGGMQRVLDVSAGYRFSLSEDDDVAHSTADKNAPPWYRFDAKTRAAMPIAPPADLVGVTDAQISDDGQWVMALWTMTGGDKVLSAAPTATPPNGSDWQTLHRWKVSDPDRPKSYALDGELEWDGGTTAWIIAQSGRLIRVDLE